ncbi:MAG: nitrous oxide-stimulated promoter family protein [Candidatus Sumerlaeia bacterium]|nr:nitrous oxide-stimulated promoter family protein [Candidatus Sumerlaeia bacterium]
MRIGGLHPEPLTPEECRDLRVLGEFIALFCRGRHRGADRRPFALTDVDPARIFGRRLPSLCAGCEALLSHGIVKRLRCPVTPKPMCKDCACQCYAPDYQARVRQVMRHSGPRMILRGRLHYLFHLRRQRRR